MIYHVLPGDSVAQEFPKTNLEGKVIVCRECLVVGPVYADGIDEFWSQRARFVLSEYGEDEIEFHEKVADELNRLFDIEAPDEVNLWFEYELFCSVNMWYCLAMLDWGEEITVYRVEPSVLSKEDRWNGFGSLDAKDLQKCFDERKLLAAEDVTLGADLWYAYRENDSQKLQGLAQKGSDRFPYIAEVAAAAIEKDTKPKQILREIIAEGITEFHVIFAEFTKRAGV